MNRPLISVVTVVYNDFNGLKKTVSSVESQLYSNIEYLIIDGASTDGTKEYLENYMIQGKWISRPDKGIYDAMNKGIDLANGDFIIFMNAGDSFYSNNTIQDCVLHFSDKHALYFGRAKINSEKEFWSYPPSKITKDNINIWLKHNVPNHQVIFFSKSFYKENYYDLSLKISADRDYKLRAFKKQNLNYYFIDSILSVFETGGVSSTYNSCKKYKQLAKESWVIDKRYASLKETIKHQIILVFKFIIFNLFGQELFIKILKKKYK
jgi:glycosyltransferase involved in cell wall biosynthesis